MSGPRRTWQAVGGYGEPGDLRELVFSPPGTYRDHYQVTGRGYLNGDRPPVVVSVTVKRGQFEATFDAAGHGHLDAPATAEVKLFWRDAQYLAGWARPPGRASEQEARLAQIAEAIRGGATTRRDAAAALGKLGEWDRESGDFLRDVRDAGGWTTLKERALRGEL